MRNVEGGSLAARLLYPDVRQERPENLPRSPVIGTDAPEQYEQRDDIGAPRKRLPAVALSLRGDELQTPAPFEYERATSVDGAIAALDRLGAEARIIAGGHSLLPMMKLRLANPEHLVDINEIAELAYIREQDGEIRIGALTRHVDLQQSELLAERLPAVPRRRGRDRRPRGAQPRHDRRLALPGGRRRGPLGRLLGGQGAASSSAAPAASGWSRWRTSTSGRT